MKIHFKTSILVAVLLASVATTDASSRRVRGSSDHGDDRVLKKDKTKNNSDDKSGKKFVPANYYGNVQNFASNTPTNTGGITNYNGFSNTFNYAKWPVVNSVRTGKNPSPRAKSGGYGGLPPCAPDCTGNIVNNLTPQQGGASVVNKVPGSVSTTTVDGGTFVYNVHVVSPSGGSANTEKPVQASAPTSSSAQVLDTSQAQDNRVQNSGKCGTPSWHFSDDPNQYRCERSDDCRSGVCAEQLEYVCMDYEDVVKFGLNVKEEGLMECTPPSDNGTPAANRQPGQSASCIQSIGDSPQTITCTASSQCCSQQCWKSASVQGICINPNNQIRDVRSQKGWYQI